MKKEIFVKGKDLANLMNGCQKQVGNDKLRPNYNFIQIVASNNVLTGRAVDGYKGIEICVPCEFDGEVEFFVPYIKIDGKSQKQNIKIVVDECEGKKSILFEFKTCEVKFDDGLKIPPIDDLLQAELAKERTFAINIDASKMIDMMSAFKGDAVVKMSFTTDKSAILFEGSDGLKTGLLMPIVL